LLTISTENRDAEWENDRIELIKKWESELFVPQPVAPVQQPHDREPDPGHRREIRFVDATPDEGFPIRILQAYKETGMFTDNTMGMPPENEIAVKMNEWQCQRNTLLDDAIKKLAKPSPAVPVQPGAVVSRWELEHALIQFQQQTGAHTMGDQEMQSTFGFPVADFYQRIVHALQLPQPLTPVQGGGVNLHLLLNEFAQKARSFQTIEEIRELIDSAESAILAHLTTTQSAPSVGSVATVELGKTTSAKDRGFRCGSMFGQEYLVDIPEGTAIHALLDSRMEGK